jgi:Protein of unknown function (DUF2934)
MATKQRPASPPLPDRAQAPTGEKPENADAEVPRSAESPPDDAEPSHEQKVREAAYRRFEARGFAHGQHEDDWAEAEKEVRPPEGN